MNISDLELLSSVKMSFDLLPQLFLSDVAIGITDLEKYILTKQGNTFKLNIEEGMPLAKGGSSIMAIQTKKRQMSSYPKEAFGFPIIACSVPIINNSTGNIVGTITYAVSKEKENNVINMANEVSAYSDNLSASSEGLSSSIKELSDSSSKLNCFMNDVESSLNNMDEVLSYIKQIANTTNMLGLNASIEASRAGEQGKGFSVVATEIRKLAANSKDSTTQINDTLLKVKTDINKVLEYINKFSDICNSQTSEAEQIALSSDKLREVSSNLLNLTEDLNK